MDAHALTLFVDIVEAGNLSLAARNMKMSRANISCHLTQLERSVGMQLMRRTTRRVELTDIGQRLYHTTGASFAMKYSQPRLSLIHI